MGKVLKMMCQGEDDDSDARGAEDDHCDDEI